MIPFDSTFKKYLGLKPWFLIIGLALFIIVWLVRDIHCLVDIHD